MEDIEAEHLNALDIFEQSCTDTSQQSVGAWATFLHSFNISGVGMTYPTARRFVLTCIDNQQCVGALATFLYSSAYPAFA